MPSGFDTVCLAVGGGVPSGETSGCTQHLAFEGELQTQLTAYTYSLYNARDAVLTGNNPGFGTSVQTPAMIAADMMAAADYWCKMYPGSCPADVKALAQKYIDELNATAAGFGFSPTGTYSPVLDSHPLDVLYPEGIQATPLALGPNVVAYSPSAGFRPPIDSFPAELSPTIPAFTSPSNVAKVAPGGSPNAAAGGTTNPGTAAGAGSSQGGTATQQNTLTPSASQAAAVAGGQSKLLIILLVLAVAVLIFSGKGN